MLPDGRARSPLAGDNDRTELIMRRFAWSIVGMALIGSMAACSSSSTTSSGTTAAPTTTAGGSGGGGNTTTTKAGGSSGSTKSAPKVTKPSTVQKVEKDKLPAKTQNATNKVTGLSADESDCIDYVVFTTIESSPELADSDEALAGVVGGSIVACVPQATIASGLTGAVKEVDSSVTDTQAKCIEDDIAAADPEALAILIGAIVIEEPTILNAVGQALNDKCGTSL